MNLSLIDYAIIAAYGATILGIGFAFIRQKSSDEDYLLAGRRLTLPAFIMTLVTTWYGAILGVGEFVFGYGIVGWITQGLMWYVVYILFAFLFAQRIHASKFITVADQLRHRIGEKSASFGALMTYIMTSPAPYILSLGVVISVIFPITQFWAIMIGAFISGIYIWSGGFRAVIRTDIVQFVLMYAGFSWLLILSIKTFGGWQYLVEHLPASHLTWHGDLGIQTIIVWGLLALWTLVDPNFYQRCYAAQNDKTASKGILIAIVFWFVFDMLTLFTGLYARAAFPEADPLLVYFTLSDHVLPFVAKGFFVVTILAIIMSTIDSFLFSSSSILSQDFFKKRFPQTSLKTLSKYGIVITIIVSLCVIWLFESVIGIIYGLGTVGVSVLLIPTLISLFSEEKIHDGALFFSMVLTALISSLWLLDGWMHAEYGWPVFRYGIEPMYVGLAASAIAIFISTFKKTSPSTSNH